MFEVFSFGSSGWGDEMLMGALMTVLVSASSLLLGILIGIIFAACKLSNIFIAKENVIIEDTLQDYKIFADKLATLERSPFCSVI